MRRCQCECDLFRSSEEHRPTVIAVANDSSHSSCTMCTIRTAALHYGALIDDERNTRYIAEFNTRLHFISVPGSIDGALPSGLDAIAQIVI